MLACTIVGLSLTGFAIALQQALAAASKSAHMATLRLALQSRVAELSAEKYSAGNRRYNFGSNVVVDETIEPATLFNEDKVRLEKIWKVRLKATFAHNETSLETECLFFQP